MMGFDKRNAPSRAELRMRCLEAAMGLRTPGTSARASCDIAAEFFAWVNEEPPAPASPAK
jgi:hypothetical protein